MRIETADRCSCVFVPHYGWIAGWVWMRGASPPSPPSPPPFPLFRRVLARFTDPSLLWLGEHAVMAWPQIHGVREETKLGIQKVSRDSRKGATLLSWYFLSLLMLRSFVQSESSVFLKTQSSWKLSSIHCSSEGDFPDAAPTRSAQSEPSPSNH